MAGKLTLVLGLAGSGKSHYIENHKSDFYDRIDDNFANPGCFAQHRSRLLDCLLAGRHFAVAEVKYLDPAERANFVRDIEDNVPGAEIDYICFENDLEAANWNCRNRTDKSHDPDGTGHIALNNCYSPRYAYPHGVKVRPIHRIDPLPKKPAQTAPLPVERPKI